ncbi:LysR substrate-binding domain-containing protein [Niveibacterium umoris]|uniref:LysR family glycine cleavage system transcriptional activator n=1 Tax=Niveibacterium umoris TaxID=1193620 RepID=A0A840BK83_9RHOO|nr:LysR substrate-binding domain-containing protein [Niveibacterium umoris]MBB4010957.1 LysR family glycine cleavage system transcriptional activator [Niveibacterium umoris]
MKRHRLPPLNAVRAFESAARLGSFVAAGEELHVTQPAIGRHVKSLEDWLGSRLFERTPRGVLLTESGRIYYEQVGKALEVIADASHDLSQRAKARWLRLIAVPGFASRWLRERLPAFRAAHPDLRIALEPNASFEEVRAGQADLGIGFGLPMHFRGRTELLMQPAIFPVCSPGYLQHHEVPRHPADLLRLTLLHEDDGTWWGDWFHSQGVRARPSSDMSYVSAEQVLDLAKSGAGVALTNPLLVADELARGELVRPIPHEARLEGYLLVWPPGRASREARAFADWLRAECQASDAAAVIPQDAPSD